MGLMEMMKYNIGALSMGERLLGAVITMVLGMATCLVALTILILCVKIMSALFRGKSNGAGNASSAPSAPKSSSQGGPAASAITVVEDDLELVAVITAAIAAVRGSNNFVIKNITEKKRHPLLSNWVTTGRFEAFSSRKSVNK